MARFRAMAGDDITSARHHFAINATEFDFAALGGLLATLANRGHRVSRWPDGDAQSVAVTVWSSASILDEDVVARAMEAQNRATHLPILIDNTEPPIGFRQIQTITVRDRNAAGADVILFALDGAKAPRVLVRRTGSVLDWVDNLLSTLLFIIPAQIAIVTLSPLFDFHAPFRYFFIVATGGAALLFGLVIHAPSLTRPPPPRIPWAKLILVDLLLQAFVIGIFGVSWITSALVDERMIGESGGMWALPIILTASSLLGIVVRWIGMSVVARLLRRRA